MESNQTEQPNMLEQAQSNGITFKCIKCGKVIGNIKDYPCTCKK